MAWSAGYWDNRYRAGGDSGAGSAGRLAAFKAETVNRIVAESGASSVVEFGCGDGRQLMLARYPSYVGLDVSTEAVRLCSERFHDDPNKSFAVSGQGSVEADVALSLDVIFHLVEDQVFHDYMFDLFGSARRLVVVYSSKQDLVTADAHVRHRDFTRWVDEHALAWRLAGCVANPFPFDSRRPDQTSFCDFYVFHKIPDTIAVPPLGAADDGGWPVERKGRRFVLAPHASSADAIAAFNGQGEAATLDFFDAALPQCDRMVDVGAYVGVMSLYAAHAVAEVHAIEASPTHQGLLADNLRRNPDLATRIRLHPIALGAAAGSAGLYRKGYADSGSSLHEQVERAGIVRGSKEADVAVHDACQALGDIGVGRTTLIKLDIEGAEYDVLPRLAALLRDRRPMLQVSFHPFNIVRDNDYETSLARLAASVAVAQALAAFPFMYVPIEGGGWARIDAGNRMTFLTGYFLQPKALDRIATAQYGFVGSIGLTWNRLAALE